RGHRARPPNASFTLDFRATLGANLRLACKIAMSGARFARPRARGRSSVPQLADFASEHGRVGKGGLFRAKIVDEMMNLGLILIEPVDRFFNRGDAR
ncbi:MAG TPA: hypothetical protein VNH64_02070, partial [Parvularculaceae bacterium]|nr:hypothetical protein [Parvularculaceae bacterium]